MALKIVTASFVIGVLLAFGAGAQAGASPIYSIHEKEHPHTILAEIAFNADDSALGGLYRIDVEPRWMIGLYADFCIRPYKKAVRRKIRESFYVQRSESRYLFSLGVDKKLMFTEGLGLFAAAGAGYTFGEYSGTTAKPEEGWGFVPTVGVVARFVHGNGLVVGRLGCRYSDVRSAEANRIYVAMGAQI